jgi:polysaccharide biosynthesis protein PslH
MKILFATPKSPLPIRGGIEIRLFNLIKPICEQHQVSLLTFRETEAIDGASLSSLESLFADIEWIPLGSNDNPSRTYRQRVTELISPPADYHGKYSASGAMRNAIEGHLRRCAHDVVLLSGPSMPAYFTIPSELPLVFDSVDSLSLYMRRAIRLEATWYDKLRMAKSWLGARQFERKYYRRFSDIVFTSAIDAQYVRRVCPLSNVTVISNGIDCEYYQPRTTMAAEPTIIFIGVMDFPPNVDAMSFFCRDVLPIVWRAVPEAHMLIVGRHPTEGVKALAVDDDRITVTGEVEDVRPWLARSQVSVCPTRSGAGIKNKILEAWACGVPVVGTRMSAQGVSARPGENMLIGDDATDMANAVITVMRDGGLRQRLAEAGRSTAILEYSWQSKANQLETILERAAAGKSNTVHNSVDADHDTTARGRASSV